MKARQVLVTGITGFIGSHTAIQLLNKGYAVRGSMRSLKRAESIREIIAQHAPIELLSFVEANLLDEISWIKAARGVEFIAHIASPVPINIPKNADDVIIPARQGTLNVLKAAKKNNVKRIVITSSVAAIAYGHTPMPKRLFSETDWTKLEHKKDTTPYIQSKVIAEQVAWQYVRDHAPDLELITINPSLVLGPILEKDYGSSAELIRKLISGELPGVPKFGYDIVDVRDVASLHIKAIEHPDAVGHRFIASAGFYTMKEIAEKVGKLFPIYERRLPKFTLPNIAVKILALVDKEVNGILLELNKRREFDNSKSKNMLNWQPRSTDESIRATVMTMKEVGVIK